MLIQEVIPQDHELLVQLALHVVFELLAQFLVVYRHLELLELLVLKHVIEEGIFEVSRLGRFFHWLLLLPLLRINF